MTEKSIDEVIREILRSIDATADAPCTNAYCADCDGKCAKKNCGGYQFEK